MYRDHISNIEKNERLEIIQKLMINIPERPLKSETTSDGSEVTLCNTEHELKDSEVDFTERLSKVIESNSVVKKTELEPANNKELASERRLAELSPARPVNLTKVSTVDILETYNKREESLRLCIDTDSDVTIRSDDVIKDKLLILDIDGVVGGRLNALKKDQNKGIIDN